MFKQIAKQSFKLRRQEIRNIDCCAYLKRIKPKIFFFNLFKGEIYNVNAIDLNSSSKRPVDDISHEPHKYFGQIKYYRDHVDMQ